MEVEEFRDRELVVKLLAELREEVSTDQFKIMEVCGTHTRALFRTGLREVLPSNLELVSGPGCPICVTAPDYIETAVQLAHRKEVMIASYGDLLKLPALNNRLEEVQGQQVKAVYSPLAALKLAQDYPEQEVVFLAVGFETTAPVIALSILQAQQKGISNYSILAGIKLMPPVMKELVLAEEVELDGFLCPGHVASIIGAQPFEFLAADYGLPAVVAGFETGDIVFALLELIGMMKSGEAEVLNCYPRVVEKKGNQEALKLLEQMFTLTASRWRGLGEIADSGLKLKESYQEFSALNKLNLQFEEGRRENPNCSCGEILRGVKEPPDCELFGTVCSPQNPVGPCMVSQEGSCAIYYSN